MEFNRVPNNNSTASLQFSHIFYPQSDLKKNHDKSFSMKQTQFFSFQGNGFHDSHQNCHKNANELIAERRIKNADASARYRDRRRRREIEMTQKHILLEKKVRELEEEVKVLNLKLQEKEIEVHKVVFCVVLFDFNTHFIFIRLNNINL